MMKYFLFAVALLVAALAAPAVEPVDKDLIPEARAVLKYLESVYGQKTIAALNGVKNVEGVRQASGKEPAIVGFDLSGWNSPPWGKSYTGVVQNSVDAAKAWWQKGGIGTISPRDPIGAKVFVTAGGRTQLREQNSGTHRTGQDMRRLHFGLGKNTTIDAVEIHWPSGAVQKLSNVKANQILRVTETGGTR